MLRTPQQGKTTKEGESCRVQLFHKHRDDHHSEELTQQRDFDPGHASRELLPGIAGARADSASSDENF